MASGWWDWDAGGEEQRVCPVEVCLWMRRAVVSSARKVGEEGSGIGR